MYLKGFGNHHQTEAIEGALPKDQNSPQRCPKGLYAEQLSGSAFTRLRHVNLHAWLYRILPSVVQGEYTPYPHPIQSQALNPPSPNPMRWSPQDKPSKDCDFVDGLTHMALSAHLNAYLYQCTQSMQNRYLSSFDGEFLFVPYSGEIKLHSEFGLLQIKPGMIAVIPRGVKFKVELMDDYAAGYLCENQGSPLKLPELGPIGANGLANPRHFNYPVAAFENIKGELCLICKYQNHWWQAPIGHSPLNVVAWHGNYAPYSYDLSLFNVMNTVSFDHPDPSIFTVLTSESDTPGMANLDFVIFPPRFMVAEHTFRPPYFHRNIMNELMGLIKGEYDAKKEGFNIGGISIHNCMTSHGPDKASFEAASKATLKPDYYDNTLAFMFESRNPWLVSEKAYSDKSRQGNYLSCWQGLEQIFCS